MGKRIIVLFLLLGAHLFLLINLRFTAWPEMVSYPYLFNNGFKLYTDFIHPYPPLLTMVLAGLFQIFGYSLWVEKIFVWVLILLSDLLIFLIVRKITKNVTISLISVGFYVLLQPFLEGNQLWFDLVIVTPVLISFYLLLQQKYFWSGIVVGLACLVKQTVGLFLVFEVIYVLFQKERFRNLVRIFIGPFVLFISLLVYLVSTSSINEFFAWNLIYPFTQWSKFPGYVQMILSTKQTLIMSILLLPLLLVVKQIKKYTWYLIFFGISLVLIYPRFSFFHFQLALAFLAILYGSVAVKLKLSRILHATYYILLFVAIALPVIKSDWNKEARFWGKSDLELAGKISQRVPEGRTVLFLGTHSAIYTFSKVLPPKPWTDNFGWYLEIPGVQEEITSRWEASPPGIIIWNTPKVGNWFDLASYQPQKITKWVIDGYTKREEITPGVWLWGTKN